jgi:apolipoprotein N-acyltransferase
VRPAGSAPMEWYFLMGARCVAGCFNWVSAALWVMVELLLVVVSCFVSSLQLSLRD